MAFHPARRWLVAVLLTAVLAPEAFPFSALGSRCACGMAVGCCCLRTAAMKSGDRCSLQPAAGCSLRQGRGEAAEFLPRKDRADWVGIAPRDRLRLPRLAAGSLVAFAASPPDLPRSAPPVPPPRPLPAA